MDCLQQFGAELQKREFQLPYEMDKGKIRDNNTLQWFSVKQQFNSEESWTKAMRYMLTNLKWGLAFVSSNHERGAGMGVGGEASRAQATAGDAD